MTLTVSDVESWNTSVLQSCASSLTSVGTKLNNQGQSLIADQDALGETWHGIAASAAAARVVKERSIVSSLVTAIDTFANVTTAASSSLAHGRNNVVAAATAPRTAGFDVADDGTVSAQSKIELLTLIAGSAAEPAVLELMREAAQMTLALVTALKSADNIASDVTSRLEAARDELTLAREMVGPVTYESGPQPPAFMSDKHRFDPSVPQDRTSAQAVKPTPYSEKELEDRVWEMRKTADVRSSMATELDEMMDASYPGHISRNEIDEVARSIKEGGYREGIDDPMTALTRPSEVDQLVDRYYPGHHALNSAQNEMNRNAIPHGSLEDSAPVLGKAVDGFNKVSSIPEMGGSAQVDRILDQVDEASGDTSKDALASAAYQQYLNDLQQNPNWDPKLDKALTKDDFKDHLDDMGYAGKAFGAPLGLAGLIAGGPEGGLKGMELGAAGGEKAFGILERLTRDEWQSSMTDQPSWYSRDEK